MIKKIICKGSCLTIIYENGYIRKKNVETYSYIREKNKLIFLEHKNYNIIPLKNVIIQISGNKYLDGDKV